MGKKRPGGPAPESTFTEHRVWYGQGKEPKLSHIRHYDDEGKKTVEIVDPELAADREKAWAEADKRELRAGHEQALADKDTEIEQIRKEAEDKKLINRLRKFIGTRE